MHSNQTFHLDISFLEEPFMFIFSLKASTVLKHYITSGNHQWPSLLTSRLNKQELTNCYKHFHHTLAFYFYLTLPHIVTFTCKL